MRRIPLSRVALADLDFARLRGEAILLVRAIAEWHQSGLTAPAPRLNDFPVDYDEVGTILG
jgi:hypothetical protein